MLILPRWVSSGLLLFHPVLCVYKISSHHNTFTSVVAHSSFQARNSPINYLFLCNLSTFWKILTLSPPQRKNVRCGWKLWNCYYRFILSKYDLFFKILRCFAENQIHTKKSANCLVLIWITQESAIFLPISTQNDFVIYELQLFFSAFLLSFLVLNVLFSFTASCCLYLSPSMLHYKQTSDLILSALI